MKRQFVGIYMIGVLFFVVGSAWSLGIYQRCVYLNRKSPTPVAAPIIEQEPAYSVVESVERTVAQARKTDQVRAYHVLAFWALVALEVICASFFILSGLLIMMRGRIALAVTGMTVVMDGIFKLGMVGFMYFFAIPLSMAVDGKNILRAYYAPQDNIWSEVLSYVTFIRLGELQGVVFALVYSACLIGALIYLYRPQVKLCFKTYGYSSSTERR